MGHVEQGLARQAIQMGQPLPERIANAPELKIGLQLYLQAFFDLDSDRNDGPIPWSSVSNYGKTFSLDVEQTDDLFYFVKRMDTAFLKWKARKEKSNAPKPA